MKIRYSVFLFFIISTYSDLIPNNRVITDSNSTKDFDLVEGITYKIVHLKSGSNLISNGNKVYTSSEPSPYQYWSLRKDDGNRYNIVNLKSSMNLDSDSNKVYIGKPKHNNLYQHWMFTKINNNVYNLVHGKSRNLDSNGRDVYISSPEHNSKDNLYQQWLFEPINYNLTALVMEFSYHPDLKDTLEQYRTHVSLLSGHYVFENHANATIEQTIDKTETKSNIYTLEIKKSDSFENSKNINFSFHLGMPIFDILGINTSIVGGIRRIFRSNYEKVYRESITETISYHIGQKIIIPPF
ncbi:hypothetical protein C1645_789930, partial [Glomus cerebriforme]